MSRIDTPAQSYSGVQTLDRSMLLVELVSRAGQHGLSAAELESASGLSIATVYRLAQALKRLGLLRQVRDRGPYLLGHQLIVWGSAAGQTQHIKRVARDPLRELVARFDESFFLFVPDGFNVLCLDIQDGSQPTRSYVTDLGSRIRHGLGQASIAILSHLPHTEYEQILARNLVSLRRLHGIERFEIDQAVAMCRRLGVTGGVEGAHPPEFTGLASPIIDPAGQPVAALSCSVPRKRMTDAYYTTLSDQLRLQARLISQRIYGAIDPL